MTKEKKILLKKLLRQYKQSLKIRKILNEQKKIFYGLNMIHDAIQYTENNKNNIYLMKIHDGSIINKPRYFWVQNGVIWISTILTNPNYDMSKNPIRLSIIMSWFDKSPIQRKSYTITLIKQK